MLHWKTITNWFKIGIAVIRDLWDNVSQGPARFLLLLTPIGLVVIAIKFLVDTFVKIKSIGAAALNFLIPPLRFIFGLIQKIFNLVSKIGGFFGKILNLGGPDTNLAKELDRQNTAREEQELNSRAQALANLPNPSC